MEFYEELREVIIRYILKVLGDSKAKVGTDNPNHSKGIEELMDLIRGAEGGEKRSIRVMTEKDKNRVGFGEIK